MSSSEHKARQALEALKKNKDREVDVTSKVSQMKMHEFMSIPIDKVKFNLSGSEIEFLLSILTRVHASLMQNIKNSDTVEEDRQAAYGTALSTEKLYDTVWNQLGLARMERDDLH